MILSLFSPKLQKKSKDNLRVQKSPPKNPFSQESDMLASNSATQYNFFPVSKLELPPEPVRSFLLEYPGYENWKSYLHFLIDNFPQVQDGQIQYLIEGGAAMHLHIPNTRRDVFGKPHDIDVICRSKELRDQFLPPVTFDVKTTEEWFRLRAIEYTEERGNFLLSCNTPVISEGRKILALNKVTLSLSKKLPFMWYKQRFKDIFDIQALGIPDEETNSLRQQIESLASDPRLLP